MVGLARLDKVRGRTTLRLEEGQRLRVVLGTAIHAAVQRAILDHAELRDALGAKYLVKLAGCRSDLPCVTKLVAPLAKRAAIAIYGDYQVERETYKVHLRAIDLRDRKLAGEARFTLRKAELEDDKAWQRELGGLLASAGIDPPVAEPPPPPPPVVAAAEPEPAAPAPETGAPELPPISNRDGDAAPAEAKPFVDHAALDALARGIVWHGYFQSYAAAGVRGARERELLLFENRLQLELESKLGPLRIVGKPELVYDLVTEELHTSFRELYAARYTKRFELSAGQRIVNWGITDFWPVVDILNPRDFTELRNWRPIDEKLPMPMLHAALVLGRVTLQAIGTLLTRTSDYQLDQARPFAIPLAVPESVPILRPGVPQSLDSGGGGASIDLALGGWKTSLYALWARNPLPTVYARVDGATGAGELNVVNERVAMGALSIQGALLGTLIKTEAAYYRRIDDQCEGAIDLAPGAPSCFYLRRVPTVRATFALERELVRGLAAHVQVIAEVTRRADIPPLPEAALQLAPGLFEQHALNRIVTLRLQGRWARGDFRPSAFIYWSIADEDWFANLDLEYHLADGFALAVGGFWFQGYANDPSRNRFTIAGSLEQSSNGYLRATAWF